MSDRPSSNLGGLDIDLARRIDEVCRRFESDVREGLQPRIEDYLVDVADGGRPALRAELEALKRELRRSEETVLRPEAGPPTAPQTQAASTNPSTIAEAETLAPGPPPTTPILYQASALAHERATLPPGNPSVSPFDQPTAAVLGQDPSATRTASEPTRIRYFGDYEIIREIARGGMGVVFRARQVSLNRTVALKMILAGQFADDTDVKRFYTEAEAAANLDHPGIVPIFEVGQHEGQHFFSMAFVEGQSLPHRLAEGPLPAREAAEMVRRVTEAIEYAHQHGVIHRDLKPANILLDQNGNPRVTDFGLAKNAQGDSGFTGSGQIMGTPSYMPPEQAGGKRGEVGPAADVYALGATLYALATGRPPFQAATPMDTVIQVISDEPVPPRRLNASIPRDLETICLKCLEKQPGKRYARAADLAEDLRRYLAGEPIVARPVGPAERALKWVRRRPVIAALCALVVGTALLGLSGITWQWRAAVAARIDAQKQAKIARHNEGAARTEAEFANRRLYDVQMNAVQRAWEDWFPSVFIGTLDEQRPENQKGVDRRGFEWYYWRRKLASGHRTLKGHPTEVTTAASLPAGLRALAIPRNRLGNGALCVAFSPDGSRLASAGFDGSVKVWDVRTGQETLTFKAMTGAVMSLVFSPDGSRIASASMIPGKPGEVMTWDASTGQKLLMLKGHPGLVSTVAYSPDGSQMAAASLDGAVTVWYAATGRERLSIKGNASSAAGVASGLAGTAAGVTFSPDLKRIAVASADGTMKLLDTATGQETLTLKGQTKIVTRAVFTPDGKHLAAAVSDQTVKFWDAGTGHETLTLDGHTRGVIGMAISPDGSRIAAATQDGTVKVWDAASGHETLSLRAHDGWVSAVTFNPDGRLLASAGFVDGTVNLWDVPAGQESITLKGHTGGVTSVAFSPNSAQIASASAIPGAASVAFADGAQMKSSFTAGKPGEVKVWDATAGRERLTIKGHTGEITSVAFSPDGSRIASAGSDASVMIWDAATGQQTRALTGHTAEVTNVAFSPDGSEIASASVDGTLRIWNAATGQEKLLLIPHSGWVSSLAFSQDGSRIASSGADMKMTGFPMPIDMKLQLFKGMEMIEVSNPGRAALLSLLEGTVKVWDAKAVARAALTIRIDAPVASVAFSPNGGHLVTSGSDGTVKVWDAASGQETLTIKAHTGVVKSVTFSPDGSRIASASVDKTVKLWDSMTGQETLTLKGHTGGVASVAFSPDGQRLASASSDGTLKVWDARPLDEDRAKPVPGQ